MALLLPMNRCAKALLSSPQKEENSGNRFMTSHARAILRCSGASSPIAGHMRWVRVTFQPDSAQIDSLWELLSSSLTSFQNRMEEKDLEMLPYLTCSLIPQY